MVSKLSMDEHLTTLVEAGGRAPSGGNMQPWRVRIHDGHVELWLDRERTSSFLDVGRYASVCALGSFAENMAIAAQGLGWRTTIDITETIDLERPLARITFSRDETLEAHPLASCIAERITNRKPHRGPSIEESVVAALAESSRHGSRLHARGSEEERRIAADILGAGDVLRLRNARMNAEMWDEVRWTPEDVVSTRDGIDVQTLEVPTEAVPQLEMLRDHEFLMKNVPDAAIVAMAAGPIMASSHICALSVEPGASPSIWFNAGRDLQLVWLCATDLGLAVQPWTALPFLILRAELFDGEGLSSDEIATCKSLLSRSRDLFDIAQNRIPLFIFRLSRADEPSARSLRRHVTDYMTLDK